MRAPSVGSACRRLVRPAGARRAALSSTLPPLLTLPLPPPPLLLLLPLPLPPLLLPPPLLALASCSTGAGTRLTAGRRGAAPACGGASWLRAACTLCDAAAIPSSCLLDARSAPRAAACVSLSTAAATAVVLQVPAGGAAAAAASSSAAGPALRSVLSHAPTGSGSGRSITSSARSIGYPGVGGWRRSAQAWSCPAASPSSSTRSKRRAGAAAASPHHASTAFIGIWRLRLAAPDCVSTRGPPVRAACWRGAGEGGKVLRA
jgi:hypothetical protein